MSAFAVPLVKIYQNGVAIEKLTIMVFLGAALPILAMAILVGLYAHFLERGCQDVKQLFKICIALPGLLVALAGGVEPKATASPAVVLMPEAKADEGKEYKCVPASDFQKGWSAVWGAITGHKPTKYWVLNKNKPSDTFILIQDVKYFVTARLTEDPGIGTIYDQMDCKLVRMR